MTDPVLPARRKPSFTERLVQFVVPAVIGALLFYTAAKLLAPMADDDDRPPIIVRNGSVHVEVPVPGEDGDRGQLKKVATSPTGKKAFYHEHGKGSSSKLAVSISGLTPTAECGDSTDFFAQRVSRLAISYSNGTVTRALDLYLEKGAVNMAVDDTAVVSPPDGDGYVLDFDKDGGYTMKSVIVTFKKKKNDTSGTPVTCTFGASPQITLLQRK